MKEDFKMKCMKRLFCLILTNLMILSLIGCGGKEQSTTLLYEESGVTMEYKMDAKGDIVHTITQTSILDCSEYTEEEIAAIEELVAQTGASYEEYEGVTYESAVEGTTLKEIITIDASNSDTLTTLSEAGLLPIDGDSTKISLKKTVESLESQGWVVQE